MKLRRKDAPAQVACEECGQRLWCLTCGTPVTEGVCGEFEGFVWVACHPVRHCRCQPGRRLEGARL